MQKKKKTTTFTFFQDIVTNALQHEPLHNKMPLCLNNNKVNNGQSLPSYDKNPQCTNDSKYL